MRIVFVSVDKIGKKIFEYTYGCSYSLYPMPNLAVLYNATILKKAGHQVSLFIIKSKKDIYRIPKASIYIIYSVILSEKIDLFLARYLSNSKVFFFGPNPTLSPQKYLKNKKHFVMRGETESYIEKAIINPKVTKGVSYLTKKRITHNLTAGIIENLDNIPIPERNLDYRQYYNPKLNYKKYTTVIGSRGCPNNCYFCVPNSIAWAREIEWKRNFPGKPPVKLRSVKNIINEFKILKKEGYEEFSFIDDQFIFGKKRSIEIFRGIKNFGLKFGLLSRADRLLDKEIIKEMSEAGCVYVDIGIESFDQEVLDDIRKDISLSSIFKAIENLTYYGIEPKINIVFGLSPKDTEEKINKTVKKTLNLPVYSCMYALATPYPGTDFYEKARQNKWINSDEINSLRNSPISYPHLNSKKMEDLASMANRRFYLRPKVIWHQLQKIKSYSSFKKSSQFFLRLLNNLRWQ